MAKDDGYLHFPVSLLRGETETIDVVKNAIAYSAWNLGISLYQDSPESVEAIIAEWLQENDIPDGFDETNPSDQVALAGAIRIGFVPRCVKKFSEIGRNLAENHSGCRSFVRIRMNIAWSAYSDDWPITKFKVLCGVISSIGNDPFKKLTHRFIRARGAGFDSPSKIPESDLLSQSATKRWIESLWMANFFQMVGHNKIRWYSIRHENDGKLASAVRRHNESKPKKMLQNPCIEN